MTPKFPIISIYHNGVDIIPDYTYLDKSTVLGVLKQVENSLLYDSSGAKWTYELSSDKVSDNFLTRLLANTVYNPLVDVQVAWSHRGSYQLQELQKALLHCIDEDDDILTQFVAPDAFKKAIQESASFEKIYQLLNKYVFDVDEDELKREI